MTHLRFLFLLVVYFYSNFALGQYNAINYSVEEGLPSSETHFVHQDHDGYIWICTDRGLTRYDGYEFKTFSTADGLTHNVVFKIFEDKNHDLWITAYDGSITIYDFKEKKFRPFWENERLNAELKNNEWVGSIGFKDNQIDLFINIKEFTRDELFRVNRKDSTIVDVEIIEEILDYDNMTIKFSTNKNNKKAQLCYKYGTSLKNVQVFKDKLDFKRIGGNHLSFNRKVGFVKSDKGLFKISVDGGVTDILIDKDNQVWVSTLRNGVYVLPSLDIELLDLSVGGSNNSVEMEGAFKDDVFFILDSGHLINYDPDKNTNKVIYSNTLLPRYGISFYLDMIVIGGSISNLTFINKNGQPKYFKLPNFEGRISRRDQYRIKDNGKTILVTNSMLDKSFIIPNKYKIKSLYPYIDSAFVFLTFDKVYKINEDFKEVEITNEFTDKDVKFKKVISTKDSSIIVSSYSSGLFISKNKKSFSLNTSNGLSSNIINDLVVDNNNTIWLATDAGISRVNFTPNKEKTFSVFNYSVNHGLPNKYIKELLYHKGYIYGTSQKGAFRFSCDDGHPIEESPSIYIQRVNNKSNFKSPLVFNADDNNIKIKYTALSPYKQEKRAFYKYELLKEGVTLDEVETNSTSANFSNLKAGNYTFSLTARTENGNWTNEKAINFKIKKHWTEWLMFRLLAMLCFLSLVYYLYQREQKKREKLYQKERAFEKMEHQLVDMELDLLRGQMNPHFVFNSLNSVQKHLLKDDAKKANKLIKRLADLLRAGLEYSKLEYIEIEQEINFLNNYMDIELERFPDRFEYKIKSIGEELDFLLPPLMIQPLCENAIKHSYGGKRVKIDIEIEKMEDRMVKITVCDDGVGFKNSQTVNDNVKTSLGLSILQKRIELFVSQGFNASYKIESLNDKNEGTCVELIIPIKE